MNLNIPDFTMAFNCKDPLGLQLLVSDEEMSSLDDDLRPIFVRGMDCPVEDCKGKPYTSINTLWSHWKKIHREKVQLYKCEVIKSDNHMCTFKSIQIGEIRKHQIKVHKLKSTELKITKELVSNTKYIAPREARCPKKGSSLNVSAREQAAIERHSRPILGQIHSGNNVNRDESVALSELTKNGEIRYKATIVQKAHWKPNPKRK